MAGCPLPHNTAIEGVLSGPWHQLSMQVHTVWESGQGGNTGTLLHPDAVPSLPRA